MPLVKRKNPPNARWAINAAEVGGMYSCDVPADQIAVKMDLGVAYVATLIDLYRGYKKFPKLLNIASIHQAKDTLAKWRRQELIRQLGEMP